MFNFLSQLSDGNVNSIKNLTALLKCEENQLNEYIYQLNELGIQVERKGKHIQLIPELPLLSSDKINKDIAPYRAIVKPVIHSTNQFLIEQIESLEKGQVCLAEYQFAGRGRRGRDWLSPFAGQIILSAYWTFPSKFSLNGLSLIIGIAIADTLKDFGAKEIGLKWPNDVLLQGRKLAGVLVEIVNRNNGLLNLIIGIGVNVSLPKKQIDIGQPWAELKETLPQFDRDDIIIELIKRLYDYLELFEAKGMAFFYERWKEWDYFFNKPVSVISEKEVRHGIERGIDMEGYLQVETLEGVIKFNGGEVSLRQRK